MDSRQMAEKLWSDYLKAKADPLQLQAKYWRFDEKNFGGTQENVCLARVDDFQRTYKNMCSLRNSNVSSIGTKGNELLTDLYRSAGCEVRRETGLEGGTKRRNIDLLLPQKSVYMSVTTTPRERKRGDWQRELQLLIAHQQTGNIQPFVFIGFMYEGGHPKLEKAKQEASRIESELRRQWLAARVVVAQDIEQHAGFISQYVIDQ